MFCVRRSRLDIDDGLERLDLDWTEEKGDVEMEPLPAVMVTNILTCLDDCGQGGEEVVEGWMAVARITRSVAYKLVMVGLADERERVRVEVFNTLEYSVYMYQPGPEIPATKQHYLELFSMVDLDRNNHFEFEVKEPWAFLMRCVEQCREQSSQFSAESLLLKLVTNILATDLDNRVRDGDVDMTERPLAAAVIWPAEPIEWNRRVEWLCVMYVAGVAVRS